MRIVLFTGKGGVGKTTLAAATAAHLARSGRKTLAVSTDPAHSLGDALECNLGGEPVEVDGTGGLFAAHVDARALLDGAWGRLREHLATVLAGAGVDELVADELTVLPGVEELLALSAVRRAARDRPVGGRRRRLRPDGRDAAAAGPARGRRGVPGAAVPRAPPGRARACSPATAPTRAAGTAPPRPSTTSWPSSPPCAACSPRRGPASGSCSPPSAWSPPRPAAR